MKRIKAKIPTWEEGFRFIKEVGETLQVPVEEWDEKQVLEISDLSVHVVPDDRGFAFVTIKVNNEKYKEKVEQILAKYKRS